MKFEEVLPGLRDGSAPRLRGEHGRLYSFGDDVYVADRKYLRIGMGQLGDLEIVAEYDNSGGEPCLFIRTFTLRRDSFERSDWDFVVDKNRCAPVLRGDINNGLLW